MTLLRRLSTAVLILIGAIVAGTGGFMAVERWSLIDALYMTVITISTVGFREIHPLSVFGRVFTMVLILSGVSVAGYTIGTVVEFMVEGHLGGLMEQRRMERQVGELKDHFIVAGYGRVGRQVAQELNRAGVPFVVIESRPEVLAECQEDGNICMGGDASAEAILESAGISVARALVAAVDTDADNVFVTLTARDLSPDIYIIARSASLESVHKLKKAGADDVICPTIIGGKRMASLALQRGLRPKSTSSLLSELNVAEVVVDKDSDMVGRSLQDCVYGAQPEILVVAIVRSDGTLISNPALTAKIESGDRVVVAGVTTDL